MVVSSITQILVRLLEYLREAINIAIAPTIVAPTAPRDAANSSEPTQGIIRTSHHHLLVIPRNRRVQMLIPLTMPRTMEWFANPPNRPPLS
jgi:hypothetical protein